MDVWKPLCSGLLPLALLALLAAPLSSAPTAESPCARGCHCAPMAGSDHGAFTANCSSPAAAAALGAGPLATRVHELRLTRHNDHLSVKEGAFRSLGGLRSLHLDHLGLVKVYPGAFRGLDHLEELDLSHNALSAGDEVSRALRDLPQLRRLLLRGNNFGSAHGSAPSFVSRTLKFMDLGRCKIRELQPAMLGGLTHLRHIVLDGNFIRTFKVEAFPHSVVSLDLSNNDIDRISYKELSKLENIDAIELSGNPVYCNCDLLQISYSYNINKPVVCAAPKQFMGKDMVNVKKYQVCGGHKKVKRDAGNELDDETLSQEDNDALDDNMAHEDDPKNAELETTNSEEDSEKESEKISEHSFEPENQHEHEENSAPNNEEHKSEDLSPSQISEPTEDLNEDGEDTEEREAGPENIYGDQESDHTMDTDADLEEITHSHGDRIVSDDKSEVEDEDEESREQLLFVPENKEVPVDEQADDDYESEKANDDEIDPVKVEKTVPNDDKVDGTTIDDSDVEKSDVENPKQNVSDDIDNIDDDTGDTLTTNYAFEDKKDDNSDTSIQIRVNPDETEETGGDEIPEDENPPESLPPSEYTKLQAAREEEEREINDNNKEEDAEGNGGGEDNKDEVPLTSHHFNLSRQPEPEISTSKEINAKLEPVDDTKEEGIDENDNLLLTGNDKENEESNEDQSSSNFESRDTEGTMDLDRNSDTINEASALPRDDVVETIEDFENVVHTSDVGARAEMEESSDPKTEEDDDEVENVPVDDVIEEAPENSGDDVENSANETEDIEHDDKTSNEPDTLEGRALDEGVAITDDKKDDTEDESGKFAGQTFIAFSDDLDDDKALEEELEEDRKHAILSHSDLTQGTDNENEKEFNVEEDNESVGDNDSIDIFTSHSTDSNEEEEITDKDEVDAAPHETTIEDPDSPKKHDGDDGLIEENYESVKEDRKEDDLPGERIALASDTEDSEEKEGSGAFDNALLPVPYDKESDWADENESKENENETVPPLENAESKEDVEDSLDSKQAGNNFHHPEHKLTGHTESPIMDDFLDSDNVTEEGSGIPINGLLSGDEDDDDISVENGYGSGASVPFVNIPEQTEIENPKDEEDEEESSGQSPFIPVVSIDDSSHTDDKTPEENVDEDQDERDEFPITSPAPIVDEDVIPKAKIPVHSAPPRAPILGRGNIPENAVEDDGESKEDNKAEDDGDAPISEVTADIVKPVAAAEDEVDKIEGAEEDSGKKHENVLAAVPPSDSAADSTEALNKENALTLNTIGSYIVLGAIMLIVVILLAYAVCRSRRQKSSPTKEKDVENAGREMQDVNKPLINNHHPPAPEKKPLDETQQPLMTKEQEASLSVEPEKTALPLDDMDHKPKQNGGVPEVVVERSAGPIANGKAASPAAVHAPLPAAPPSPIAESPTAPPAASPTASPPRSPAHSPSAANGSAIPVVNGGTHSPPRAASPEQRPASSPAAGQPPVSPGAVRVVAKELPDSVAKRPVIIMNRGAEPAQQV